MSLDPTKTPLVWAFADYQVKASSRPRHVVWLRYLRLKLRALRVKSGLQGPRPSSPTS